MFACKATKAHLAPNHVVPTDHRRSSILDSLAKQQRMFDVLRLRDVRWESAMEHELAMHVHGSVLQGRAPGGCP